MRHRAHGAGRAGGGSGIDVDTIVVNHATHHAHVDLGGPPLTPPLGPDYTACVPNPPQPRNPPDAVAIALNPRIMSRPSAGRGS
jgi:hypothetical protein